MRTSIVLLATISCAAAVRAPRALAAPSADPRACQSAFVASGLDWVDSAHSLSRRIVHPAYSEMARAIYFTYEIPGLTIHLEQGPHEGMHMSGNEIRRFYLDYDPRRFARGSFYRRLFGRKPLRVTEADVGRHYWTSSLVTDREGDQILTIFVPHRAGLAADAFDLHATQLLIARSTGKVFGYGPRSRNVLVEFATGCWMELRNGANAERCGRGSWFNSDSNLPPPTFGTE